MLSEEKINATCWIVANYLGNALPTISDRKLPYSSGGATVDFYQPEIISSTDYYPFGMVMNRRDSSNSKYRFGFNGQEKLGEIDAEENSYEFEFRAYDPRIARFRSVDPLVAKYPMYTAYAFAANQPIHSGDIEGLENPEDKNSTLALPDEAKSSGETHSDDKKRWTYTGEPGLASNIDLSISSSSGNFRFNGQATGVNGNFHSYDSKQNLKKLGGDQANHYLVTAKNETNGFTITGGVLHDKREQDPSGPGNQFRYEGGGLSPTLMFGKQLDFNLSSQSNLQAGFQAKAGIFFSFNNIGVDLNNPATHTTYTSTNGCKALSGGGFVAMSSVSCSYVMSKSWSVSTTSVSATNNSTGSVNTGSLSVGYSSFSAGPSLSLTLRK